MLTITTIRGAGRGEERGGGHIDLGGVIAITPII
jgi:hypothetical protein